MSGEIQSEVVYARAPITDAILELRLPADRSIKLDLARRIANETMRNGLDESLDYREYRAKIGDGSAAIEAVELGKEVSSTDRRLIVRPLTNAFAFIQRSPYRDWWYFERTARKYWEIYRAALDVNPVRIGLRFINMIPILAGEEIQDYFTCYPTISLKLPQVWSTSTMRIAMQIPDSDYSVGLVHQWTGVMTVQGRYDMTLDIDVSVESPTQGFTTDEIWERLTQMRKIKNQFFEESITEKVRESIR